MTTFPRLIYSQTNGLRSTWWLSAPAGNYSRGNAAGPQVASLDKLVEGIGCVTYNPAMQYNEVLLLNWSNQVGEEMRQDFANPDIASIEVVRMELVPGTDPPEVCVYWVAKMKDGKTYPKEAYFSVEIPDIEDMGQGTYSKIAGSKVFAHLAPELKKN